MPAGPDSQRAVAAPLQRIDGNAAASSALDAGTNPNRSAAPVQFDVDNDPFGPHSGIGAPDPDLKVHSTGADAGAIVLTEYPLVIWLKAPYAATAKKLVLATKLQFFGKPASGSLSTFVTAKQLTAIFGLNVERWTDKNAGNSIGVDAHHFRIENKRLLRPALKGLIRDIELNDDPKRELIDEEPEYRPE